MAFWLPELETYKLKGFRVFIYKRTIVYIQLKKIFFLTFKTLLQSILISHLQIPLVDLQIHPNFPLYYVKLVLRL